MFFKLNIPILSSLVILLSGCHTAIQYSTLKTQGQNVDELNHYLNTKTVVLIHPCNYKLDPIGRPIHFKVKSFNDFTILGEKLMPKHIFHKTGEDDFDVYAGHLNEHSEAIQGFNADPIKTIHIYYILESFDDRYESIDRSRIIGYDVHKFKSKFKYSSNKEYRDFTFENTVLYYLEVKEKRIIVNSTDETYKILLNPLYEDRTLSGELSEAINISHKSGQTKFEYQTEYIELGVNHTSDSTIHPMDVLHISTHFAELNESQISICEKDVSEYFTHKQANFTSAKTENIHEGVLITIDLLPLPIQQKDGIFFIKIRP